MSTCPRGSFHTEVHILCSTYCLGWDDQTRNSGERGSYPAWRGEGPGSGISQRLLGLCWHPVRLCYQLHLGITGLFKGNPGLRVWWDSLGSKVEKQKCAFDLCSRAKGLLKLCGLDRGGAFMCVSLQESDSLTNFMLKMEWRVKEAPSDGSPDSLAPGFCLSWEKSSWWMLHLIFILSVTDAKRWINSVYRRPQSNIKVFFQPVQLLIIIFSYWILITFVGVWNMRLHWSKKLITGSKTTQS